MSMLPEEMRPVEVMVGKMKKMLLLLTRIGAEAKQRTKTGLKAVMAEPEEMAAAEPELVSEVSEVTVDKAMVEVRETVEKL